MFIWTILDSIKDRLFPVCVSLVCITAGVRKGKFAISWLSLCGGRGHTEWRLMQGTKLNFNDYSMVPRKWSGDTPYG